MKSVIVYFIILFTISFTTESKAQMLPKGKACSFELLVIAKPLPDEENREVSVSCQYREITPGTDKCGILSIYPRVEFPIYTGNMTLSVKPFFRYRAVGVYDPTHNTGYLGKHDLIAYVHVAHYYDIEPVAEIHIETEGSITPDDRYYEEYIRNISVEIEPQQKSKGWQYKINMVSANDYIIIIFQQSPQ